MKDSLVVQWTTVVKWRHRASSHLFFEVGVLTYIDYPTLNNNDDNNNFYWPLILMKDEIYIK